MMRWLLHTRVPAALTVYMAALVVVLGVCSLVGTAAGRRQGEGWIVTVSPKGQPWVVHYKQGSGEAKLYDLHFRPPSPQEHPRGLRAAGMSIVEGPSLSNMHPGWQWATPDAYFSYGEYFVEGYEATGTDRLWFWLPRERVFEAYSTHSRRPAGRLGLDGFHAHGRARPFGTRAGDLLNSCWRVNSKTWVVVPQRDRASLVHLLDDTVRTLAQEPGGYSAAALIPAVSGLGGGQPSERMHIFLRAPGRLDCYDFAGRRTTTVSLTPRERAARYLNVARADNGTLVLVASSEDGGLDGGSVRSVTPEGKTLQETVLNMPAALKLPPAPERIAARLTACVAPPWQAAGLFVSSWSTAGAAWTVAVSVIVGLLSAVVLAVKARRKVVWSLYGLVGGLPAVAAYFATAEARTPAVSASAPVPEGIRIIETETDN